MDEKPLDQSYYDRKYRETYSDLAPDYDRVRFGLRKSLHPMWFRNEVIVGILAHRKLISGRARIIDLASGTGRLAHELVKHDFSHVCAVDLTVEMLAESKKNVDDKHGDRLSWVLGDMKKLGFPDDTFDAATIGGFFYLIPQRLYDEFTKEVARVLKPGGWLICEVSNALYAANPIRLAQILRERHWKKQEVMSYVYPWELAQLFSHFDLERAYGVDYPFLRTNYRVYKAFSGLLGSRFLPTRYLGSKYILALRNAK